MRPDRAFSFQQKQSSQRNIAFSKIIKDDRIKDKTMLRQESPKKEQQNKQQEFDLDDILNEEFNGDPIKKTKI